MEKWISVFGAPKKILTDNVRVSEQRDEKSDGRMAYRNDYNRRRESIQQ